MRCICRSWLLPAQLRDFFAFADAAPVAGFSVTIPHKQKIMRYLDIVDPLARRIGAVNTVWKKAGKWRGANTDAAGVVKPLEKHMRLAKASVLIVGNGGAARGAACALADAGANSRADRPQSGPGARAGALLLRRSDPAREQLNGRKFDALVHATPMGMFPHPNECFFDGRHPAEIVFDMVYNPLETLSDPATRGAGQDGDPGNPDVHRTGSEAVRDLDRRNGAARRHGEGRDGGAGAKGAGDEMMKLTRRTLLGSVATAGGAGTNPPRSACAAPDYLPISADPEQA